MNRWRSSVFLIWTRMYLYITVYSPLLFCVFFLLLLLVFLDSCRGGFCLFERRAFFASRPLSFLFLSFSAHLKERKKKQTKEKTEKFCLHFRVVNFTWKRKKLSDANKRERECVVAEIEKYDRRKSPKRRRSIEEGTFPFLLSFCVLWCFVREEREKREPKKTKKERKNSLGPKKSGFSRTSKRASKEGGYKIFCWIVSKTFHSIIIGQFKFQLAS